MEDQYGATQPDDDRHRAWVLAIPHDFHSRVRSRQGLGFVSQRACHSTRSVSAAGAAGPTYTPNPTGPSDPIGAASPPDPAPTARTTAALGRLRQHEGMA